MSDWQPIETAPREPVPVLLFYGRREWRDMAGNPVSLGDVRDTAERSEIGFWSGDTWCDAGTGHDCFESWRDERDLPTHWMPLPEPPEQSA